MNRVSSTLLALIFVVCSLFLLMMAERSRDESRVPLRVRLALDR
jgi:hypothetical protein